MSARQGDGEGRDAESQSAISLSSEEVGELSYNKFQSYIGYRSAKEVVNTFKKYEVKGETGGIHGDRTYGYDVSRVDGRLIRRGRPN